MDAARIFVVEDEFIIAEDIQESLTDMGYSVCGLASFGEDAVEKVGKKRPDLVLMDIFLKGDMDGISTADRVRSLFNIPVVYLTAYANDAILERAKVTGPFGYLIKPFTDRELRAAIEMAIFKHNMEQEKEKNIGELKEALANVKQLSGLLPICASCKKIRDDAGYWNQIESYIAEHTDALFSHSICPTCAEELYGKDKWFKNHKSS
ncbi:MAG TPA: response regulator [Desulfobacteraceae bacterium]|nr:response regulator [Desulfobacteraceae bacterium]|tara:strand:- start:248 stop:868 length:621 start_codon:yes stop_codon:yes gene_type:complete